MGSKHEVTVRRVYEAPSHEDGARVLVDRLWPRGMSKERAHLDEWCKEVAPSTALRTWYHHAPDHAPDRFEEFAGRYREELKQAGRAAALAHLREMADERSLTLLTATKEADSSEAAVLVDLIRG